MFSIIAPLLVAVVGALVYGFAVNPRLQEMGRIAYGVGLFWTVAELTGKVLSVLK